MWLTLPILLHALSVFSVICNGWLGEPNLSLILAIIINLFLYPVIASTKTGEILLLPLQPIASLLHGTFLKNLKELCHVKKNTN